MAQKQISGIETTLDRDDVKSSEDYRFVRDTSSGSDVKTPAGSAGGYDVGTDNDEVPDNASARRVEEIDVAGDSDVTLTESQATAGTLRLTGELTADIALIVPDAERVYQVINEATGGYSITVRTDTGTGVTIEKGTGGIAWLRSDGDDVVRMTGTADDEVPTNATSHQYIDGSTTVTPDSDDDYTLSSEEARTGRLVLADGDWTSGHNIVVPDSEKRFYVDNSGGSYDATIKTADGEGVTVAPGTVALVYCDGTDVVIGFDEFPTMPTVDGNPIVESGSNSDGEWTRWADGTQVCTKQDSGTSSQYSEVDVTFAQVFSSLEFASGIENGSGLGGNEGSGQYLSIRDTRPLPSEDNDRVIFNLQRGYQERLEDTEYTFAFVAQGRWT